MRRLVLELQACKASKLFVEILLAKLTSEASVNTTAIITTMLYSTQGSLPAHLIVNINRKLVYNFTWQCLYCQLRCYYTNRRKFCIQERILYIGANSIDRSKLGANLYLGADSMIRSYLLLNRSELLFRSDFFHLNANFKSLLIQEQIISDNRHGSVMEIARVPTLFQTFNFI